MEEINILSDNDRASLLDAVEKSCSILLPRESERMGNISFHLYQYKSNSENPGHNSYVFQIRWGAHKIFSKKQLKLDNLENIVPALQQIITSGCQSIKTALTNYCQSQLNAIASLEIEPELNKRKIQISGYQLGVCTGRKKKSQLNQCGWPSLCIFISWFDDLGDFQEFMHPIEMDCSTRQFKLSAPHIVSKFQIYRDSAT